MTRPRFIGGAMLAAFLAGPLFALTLTIEFALDPADARNASTWRCASTLRSQVVSLARP